MAARAELRAKLSLDKSAFSRGLKAAGKEAKEFGKSVAAFVGGKLIADGLEKLAQEAINAGRALAEGVKHAYDLGSELQDMSDKTGIAVDQILILQQAAKDNGIEDITGAIGKMQKNLVDATRTGTGPAAEALDVLGLSADDLVNKLPTEQLQIIGERINAIRNPALKTAEAMALFGKSGKELLPLFADQGALGTAAKSLGKQAQILRDNAQAFDKISDRLGRAGLKLQGFFVGIAADVLPYMELVTKKFDELDLADQGIKFGEGIKTAVEFLVGAFNDPSKFFGMMLNYLKGGLLLAAELWAKRMVMNAANFWANMVDDAGKVVDIMVAGFEYAGQALENAVKYAFKAGLEFLLGGWQEVLSHMAVSLTIGFVKAAELFAKLINAAMKLDFKFDLGDEVAKTVAGTSQLVSMLGKGVSSALSTLLSGPENKTFSQFYSEAAKNNPMHEWAEEMRKAGFDLANRIDFGSKAFLDAARKAAAELRKKGRDTLTGMMPPKPEPPGVDAMRAAMGGGWGALSSFASFGGMGLSTGGIHSGSIHTGAQAYGAAYNQTPLIRHGERRNILNANYAQAQAGLSEAMNSGDPDRIQAARMHLAKATAARSTNPNAYGAIHHGDKGRAKAYAREQARKKLTLEGTNERLDTVIGLLEVKPLEAAAASK